MKILATSALAAFVAGCADATYAPPAQPAAAIATLGVRPVQAGPLTADYTHRTPVEPTAPEGVAPADPGFSRPRIGS